MVKNYLEPGVVANEIIINAKVEHSKPEPFARPMLAASSFTVNTTRMRIIIIVLASVCCLSMASLPHAANLASKTLSSFTNVEAKQSRHLQRIDATNVEETYSKLAIDTEQDEEAALLAKRSKMARDSSTDKLFDLSDIQHNPPLEPHTLQKTVLVTGAAGFVGSHAAHFLLNRGDRVIVLDEVNDYYNVEIKESNLKLLQQVGGSNVQIYRGDVANKTLVEHIFETEGIEWVVHLAARAGVRPSILNPFVYIHSNIKGTVCLFETAVKYGVENFVQASSSSVYGGSKSTLFDESENVDFPISPYAATKRTAEFFGMYYSERFALPVTSLRFFTVYGPRGRPDMAPFLFIDWMARGQTIRQFGDGSSSRDYTFVDDIVQGVVGALDRPTPVQENTSRRYQNVNLGKGSGTSLKDFVQLVAKHVGKEPKIKILPDQPGDVPYTCANITVAHTMLDYTPQIPFETGIQKTVEWYKEAFPYNDRADGDDTKTNERVSLIDSSEEDLEKKERRRLLKNSQSSQHRRRLRRVQALSPNRDSKKVLVVAQQESTLLTEEVVNALTGRGDSVAVIVPSACLHEAQDVDTYRFEDDESVFVYSGCVNNSTFLEHVLAKELPKWVVYLNTLSNATESKQDPYAYIDVNLQSFARLLQSLKDSGIMNLVVTSSTAIYKPTHVWHAETESIDQFLSPFAITQKARELLSHTWHALYRIPMTTLRLPQVYGLGACPFCHDTLLEGEEEYQEFMYVTDMADGIIRSLDRPFPYQILNLGLGPDLVEEACQSHASLKAMLMAQIQGEFFATSRSLPCALTRTDKARDRIGFSPKVRLREGIRLMAAWFRERPQDFPAEWQNLAVSDSDTLYQPGKAASADPPLPWEAGGQLNRDEDKLNSADDSNIVPTWAEELAQVQWLLVACFVMYKFLSWGRTASPRLARTQ